MKICIYSRVSTGEQDTNNQSAALADWADQRGFEVVYYAWLRDFMEAGKTRLAGDTVRDATRTEVDSLRRENERLKQLVANLSLQVHILKKTKVPGLE